MKKTKENPNTPMKAAADDCEALLLLMLDRAREAKADAAIGAGTWGALSDTLYFRDRLLEIAAGPFYDETSTEEQVKRATLALARLTTRKARRTA